ncbi:PREDICTED: CASP-like protein ARALYDRAFT_316979 isoform X2 [Tarenaya hassleriana]|uniref:CASP-like protein ARALYDRAFT_316979 isoform X1 n=1 Tax=Tarenaya hassleriana TaxID=28532 RepID=UPI00053C4908|nr:PREDICTED: CASP-like protein ARALYDRAFT_316979 isoform X1 [Tarenaya hassleriana]XP_010539486.1 PREDICTED: CASP-like protein ARALYDRAFT_316979 isoform X2 [Tarenaya hassleriana]
MTKEEAAAEERGGRRGGRRREVAEVALRGGGMAAAAAAMALMLTAREEGVADIYGFQLSLSSKWSFSPSYQYLVAVSAAASLYLAVQFLVGSLRLLRRNPVIPSRQQAWFIFMADQIFAYGMMSAGSAACGVTNLNRTGIRHTPLPDFCKSLHSFCNHVALSILFTFLSCLFLASSALFAVLHLSSIH